MVRRRRIQAEREKREAALALQNRSRSEKVDADRQAAASVAVVPQFSGFHCDWCAGGHPFAEVYDDFDALARHTADIAADPYIIPTLVKDCAMQPSDVLKDTLVAWKPKFLAHASASHISAAQHELTDTQGKPEVMKMFASALPEKYVYLDRTPVLKRVFIFGFAHAHTNFSFEPSYLGSARYIEDGAAVFLLMDALDLANGIAKLGTNTERKIAMSEWGKVVPDALKDEACVQKFLAAGIKTFQIRAVAGQMVIIPPGFFVAVSAIGESAATHGVRLPFLAPGPSCIARLRYTLQNLDRADVFYEMLESLLGSLELKHKLSPPNPSTTSLGLVDEGRTTDSTPSEQQHEVGKQGPENPASPSTKASCGVGASGCFRRGAHKGSLLKMCFFDQGRNVCEVGRAIV